MKGNHEMKGLLAFQLLWMISQGSKTGAEITELISQRRGSRPSPGTIYPALKYLKEKKLITSDKNKSYSLTEYGDKELRNSLKIFFSTFCDIEKMRKHHKR